MGDGEAAGDGEFAATGGVDVVSAAVDDVDAVAALGGVVTSGPRAASTRTLEVAMPDAAACAGVGAVTAGIVDDVVATGGVTAFAGGGGSGLSAKAAIASGYAGFGAGVAAIAGVAAFIAADLLATAFADGATVRGGDVRAVFVASAGNGIPVSMPRTSTRAVPCTLTPSLIAAA